METVAKLIKFNKTLFYRIFELTAKQRERLGDDPTPPQLTTAREFIRRYESGEVPQTVFTRYREMIGEQGRAAADEWIAFQREAYKAEAARMQTQIQVLKDKGFQISVPNEAQTISLLLRWALDNAPADILQPAQEDLDALVPRIPPDVAPTPKKSTKASRR